MARNFRYFEKKRGHRRTGSRFLGSVGEAVFFTVLLGVGCAGIVAGIVWLIIPEWRVNHGFVANTCRVIDRRVVEILGEKGPLYRPEIKIEYEVQGVIYAPYTYDIHRTPRSTREEANEAVDRFDGHEAYTCWYDPADPGVAVVVRGYQWWIWPALMIPVSFVVIGIAGLIYTALHWGRSAERRAATARSIPAPELFDLPVAANPKFPFIPDCSEITSSPGTRLAYRLPLTQSPGWMLFGLLAACIAWNGAVSVFLVVAVNSFVQGTPDWLMTFFVLPFLGVGVAMAVVFMQLLRHTAGIGPTLVEVSAHPLVPGQSYRVFISQSGNLKLKSLTVWLICEEEAVFLQGTNARTETREVFRETVYAVEDAVIRPGEPLEAERDLAIPADGMHSFRAKHNQVSWKLLALGEVAGSQSFHRWFPLVVQPCAAMHGDGRVGA